MAINFSADATVVGNGVKQVYVKVAKLTFANFGVTPVNTMIMRLPPDATMLGMRYYNKTKLAGNSISAATLSIGHVSAGTGYVNAFDVFTTVGTEAALSPIGIIMTGHSIPNGLDYSIWASGAATTGDPDAGEIYVSVYYVR
jgi:hypothetical protein